MTIATANLTIRQTKSKAMCYRAAMLATLVSLAMDGNFGIAAAAEPAASAPIYSNGQATTFRTSGTIDRASRQEGVIAFFADTPFWGPPRAGGGQVYLWPKDTLFVLFVPAMIPITIDGKKASFRDLTVGQKLEVQYNMAGEGGLRCVAHRITAHAATNTFVPNGQTHPARLVGHWRSLGRNVVIDYWFAADGTFRDEVAEAGAPLRGSSGKWSVLGDKLTCDVTQSTSKYLKAGTRDQDKLIQLAKDYYVIETPHGNQHRYTRLK